MRFRTGVVIGFGVGYYLGAKAGRERYFQLRTQMQKMARAEPVVKAIAAGQVLAERVRSRPEVDGFLQDVDRHAS
ncbi:MAG: hypothetical protein ACOYNI_09315 [Acidimicrobiia bacterium]